MSLQHFNSINIDSMEQRFRATLINCLSGFKSANLIGTADKAGRTNLAIFSSVVHLGAYPPLVGFIMRPNTVKRDTLSNIESTGVYTINHVNNTIWQQAHQTSAKYDAKTSEFEAVSLTPEYHPHIKAPFVKESRIKFAVELSEVLPIKANNTLMIIGTITDIYLPSEVVRQDGFVDIEACESVAVSGLDSYHTTKRLARLAYAQTDRAVELIRQAPCLSCR